MRFWEVSDCSLFFFEGVYQRCTKIDQENYWNDKDYNFLEYIIGSPNCVDMCFHVCKNCLIIWTCMVLLTQCSWNVSIVGKLALKPWNNIRLNAFSHPVVSQLAELILKQVKRRLSPHDRSPSFHQVSVWWGMVDPSATLLLSTK